MEKIRHLPLAAWKPLFDCLFLCFLLSACSTSNELKAGPARPFMPADMQNLGREGSARSISAVEALSRGVAAVTPPGAALQDVYYEFDSINLRNDAEATLKQNADWMKANPSARVEVEGHCDDRGTVEYNVALGQRRANAVANFYGTAGISRQRIKTISYGEERPVCRESSDACWAQNRRGVTTVRNDQPISVSPDTLK